jgi:hypothetical protein
MPSTPLFSFRARAALLENPDGLRLWYALDTHAETGPIDLDAEEAVEVASLWERLIALVTAARDRAPRDPSLPPLEHSDDERHSPRFTDPFALRPRRGDKP